MAQDATGTPTSQGIPKYNTAADSPSGKGFNAAMDAIDALIVAKGAEIAAATTPAGTVTLTARTTAPTGWALCQGQELNRTTESVLFAAIGTTYGVGNGTTTFNVPDLKGRVPVGQDTGQVEFDSLNEKSGAKTHTLTLAEIPVHNHGITDPWHNHGITDPSHLHGPAASANYCMSAPNFGGPLGNDLGSVEAYAATTAPAVTGITINGSPTGITINNAGSGSAHSNLQPYIVMHYMIKK